MKSLFKRIIHSFQFALDYPFYWYLRMGVCKWGGVKRKVAVMMCRRIEAKKCSTTGTGPIGNSCMMCEPLILPHGLSGITIARNVKFGKHVAIYQHVTIAESDRNKKTIIEDNVIIGAGAVILNNPHIGHGAKIGANAVVLKDVPANATAVGVPARVINH